MGRAAFIPSLLLLLIVDATANDWPVHSADKAGTRYSQLTQINRENVTDLKRAWTYRNGEMQRRGAAYALSMEQNIPILVGGQLIVCTPFNRVIALDPATGEERWTFDPELRMDFEMPSNYACRGVAQWVDPEADDDAICQHRLLFGTNDLRIFAIDATSGQRCPQFGDNGEVRTQAGEAQAYAGEIRFLMPPAIINGVAVFGSASSDYGRAYGISGKVRAIDARSGHTVWEFDPIPKAATDPAAGDLG